MQSEVFVLVRPVTPGPSFSPVTRVTSVDVSPIVDSGRFSALAEDLSAVSPTLLDSLAEDLRGEMEDVGDEVVMGRVAPSTVQRRQVG